MFYKRIYQMFAFIGLLIFIFLYGFNFTKSPKVEDFVEALTFTLLGISLMFFKPSEKIAKRLKKRLTFQGQGDIMCRLSRGTTRTAHRTTECRKSL